MTDRGGQEIDVDATLENSPAVLFDALVLPDSDFNGLVKDGRALEFIQLQYRHCKAILALGQSLTILEGCGISVTLTSGQPDPGLIVGDASNLDGAAEAFIEAIGKHRHPDRETDPPAI